MFKGKEGQAISNPKAGGYGTAPEKAPETAKPASSGGLLGAVSGLLSPGSKKEERTSITAGSKGSYGSAPETEASKPAAPKPATSIFKNLESLGGKSSAPSYKGFGPGK
jgi:hypothetical protein